MDENIIEVTINGTTYYLQASEFNNLVYKDGKLINISNSTITLVHSFDTTNTYPRITCSAMSACRYYASSNVNYTTVTSPIEYSGSFNINTIGTYGFYSYILLFLILILGVKLLWKR